MKKKLITFLILISVFPITYSNYEKINPDTKKVFDLFYKTGLKNSRNTDGLEYLEILKFSLDNISNGEKINEKNKKTISELQKLNNEKIFEIELKKEEEKAKRFFASFPSLSKYKNIAYNKDFIFKKDWIWYSYDFKIITSLNFIDEKTLKFNRLDNEDFLVFYENNTFNFVKDYKIQKLISDKQIYGFPNKRDLLVTLRNNKILWNHYDDDESFESLRKISLDLTKDLYNNDDKIAVLYNYILDNVEYTKEVNMDDFRISSWIETFKNKNWVCEWYVEIFQLMLWFNDIPSDIVSWDVTNASDFPYIWHAWLKIFNYYYDPTFDDPFWIEKTKTPAEYDFFKLPREVLYTDRFDEWKTPEYLKKASLENREALIRKNRALVYPKYKNKNYNILLPIKFKEKIGISLDEKITIENLKNNINYWEFDWINLSFNNTNRKVNSMSYFEVNDENIETFLKQINYDFSDYILIFWKENWTNTYIITKLNDIEYK